MRASNRELTLAGVIVVAPGDAGEVITNEQKVALDALHLRKIDLADRVLVVNPADTSASPRARRSPTPAPPASRSRSPIPSDHQVLGGHAGTRSGQGLVVSADGTGVVAQAGNVATRMLSDQAGVTDALSGTMVRKGFTPTHDLLTTGRVLADVAVLIAGGGEAIGDIRFSRWCSRRCARSAWPRSSR